MTKFALALAATMLAAAPANAALALFKNYTGNIGVSTSGGGSNAGAYSFSNNSIPFGATVIDAYLYQGGYSLGASAVTLNGNAVAFGASVPPAGHACCALFSQRADVTAIVKPIVDGGPGGSYNWNITESNSDTTDGTALVIVYNLASNPTQTVSILDGFAEVAGSSASVLFGGAIDPNAAGFFAELRIGDNFSCCSQRSSIEVNGTLMTENAGNNDDGQGPLENGQLFTIGDDLDGFSPALPSYDDDTERYNLVPFLTLGDTGATIDTFNGSNDDNIFLAVFNFAGEGRVIVDPTPAPGALALFGLGAIALGFRRRG